MFEDWVSNLYFFKKRRDKVIGVLGVKVEIIDPPLSNMDWPNVISCGDCLNAGTLRQIYESIDWCNLGRTVSSNLVCSMLLEL